MADIVRQDPINDKGTDLRPPVLPTIGQLTAAIQASDAAASYPDATLRRASRADLLSICRVEGIDVSTSFDN